MKFFWRFLHLLSRFCASKRWCVLNNFSKVRYVVVTDVYDVLEKFFILMKFLGKQRAIPCVCVRVCAKVMSIKLKVQLCVRMDGYREGGFCCFKKIITRLLWYTCKTTNNFILRLFSKLRLSSRSLDEI